MMPVPRLSQFRTSRPKRFETVHRNIGRVCEAVNSSDGDLKTEITENVLQVPVSLTNGNLHLCSEVDRAIISYEDIGATAQRDLLCPCDERPPPC